MSGFVRGAEDFSGSIVRAKAAVVGVDLVPHVSVVNSEFEWRVVGDVVHCHGRLVVAQEDEKNLSAVPAGIWLVLEILLVEAKLHRQVACRLGGLRCEGYSGF